MFRNPGSKHGKMALFGPRKSAILRHFLTTPPGFVRRLIGPIERVGAIGRTGPIRPTIDPDGSFIYWPDLDAHLGWKQFL